MKKILITGTKSYIGRSVERYLSSFNIEYNIDFISVRDDSWRVIDLSEYSAILHVAATVHTQENEQNKNLFFQVNRDLTIEIAKKAKDAGVKQFIFLSTMAVYGELGAIGNDLVITNKTEPRPRTYYGKSKLEAENELILMQEDSFKVAILRPPMIYGEQSPGNYRRLELLSRRVWLFPMIDNRRSVLNINKLCTFIKKVIDAQSGGLFFPQDQEYLTTSLLVKELASKNGRTVYLSSSLGKVILRFGKKIGVLQKIFGNLVYEKEIE